VKKRKGYNQSPPDLEEDVMLLMSSRASEKVASDEGMVL
jgi:hypothetical protein